MINKGFRAKICGVDTRLKDIVQRDKKRAIVPLGAHRLLDFRVYPRTEFLLGFRELVARL